MKYQTEFISGRTLADELASALAEVQFRKLAVTMLTLLFASSASTALLLVRILHSGDRSFAFLPWNLLLAWMPLGFAVMAWCFHRCGHRARWAFWLCAAAWLVWFPNAPYIFTDLIHLRQRPNIPLWFDMILILSFASTGLLLAFFSLNVMHRIVAHTCGWLIGWGFTIAAVGLAGFGVYLGRFLRWSSWDILLSPLSLFRDIGSRLFDPLAHGHGLAFAAVFSVFLWLLYVMLYCVSYWQPTQLTLPAVKWKSEPSAPL
jgi:uncharacterized membrane protein